MDFPLPEIGEGVYEAEFVRWLVKPGEAVTHGQNLAEVMTDKATMEVPSPFDGTVTKLLAEPGQKVKVGSALLTFDGKLLSEPQVKVEAAATEPRRNGPVAAPTPLSVRAAPSVRHMARKLGIDLTQLRGSGPGGRILIDDLSGAVQKSAPAKPQAALRLDVGVPGTRIKMVGLRRKIAEHMVEAKNAIPHYTYIDEVDVTDLVKLRSLAVDHYARGGVKLTYLAFFVKAAVQALKDVPIVNSTFDEKANEIVLHDRYDIGIAVATPGGLVVPVIRDADRQDLGQLAREIERLGNDARAGKPKREDLGGGTFTITSIGGFGGLISTPIINHPEVAILGVGKVVKRPMFDDAGRVVPADVVYLSISFDHRIVDGAVGALFGNALVKHLKQPAALLLPDVV
ncbi:MAG: dihydrolipoamide acetyltransferase family protein [Gemmataceae bacterium]